MDSRLGEDDKRLNIRVFNSKWANFCPESRFKGDLTAKVSTGMYFFSGKYLVNDACNKTSLAEQNWDSQQTLLAHSKEDHALDELK